MNKSDLMRYLKIKRAVQSKIESVERAESIMFPKTPKLTGMPSGGRIFDSFGDAVLNYIEQVDGLTDMVNDMTVELGLLEDAIDSLDDLDQQTVLRYKYICGYTWQEVVDALDGKWSESTCRRIHTDALKRLRKYDG